MAVDKKILILVVCVLATALIVAFGSVFSGSPEEDYFIEGDVVFAYFKAYNVSESVDVLAAKKLVSYVLVLNITNPNDVTVHLERVLVDLMQSATKTGTSVSGTNSIIRYECSFADNEMSNYWTPHSSRLVAFTGTGEVADLQLDVLKSGKGYLLVNVNGRTQTDSPVGMDLNLKEVTLEITGHDEYVFNSDFMNNYRFRFRNDSLDLSYEG